MLKNTANQKVLILAYDIANDGGKTGDAANITAYISKDGAAPVQSNDANPTELDATNMPGVYVFDLTQEETNCNSFILYAKSATSNIQIDPVRIETQSADPATGAAVTTVGGALATHDGKLDTVDGIVDWIKAVLEGDSYIDTSDPTQYQIVVHKKGDSVTEYIRKDLKDVNGDPITSETRIIGQQKEPV